MRKTSGIFTVLLAAVWVTACEPEQSNSPLTIRDSAGVRIVDIGSLSTDTAFEFGPPRFRVGWAQGHYSFSKIRDGVLLLGGKAALGDNGNGEIVVLGPFGEVEAVFGRWGQGPEEIGRLVSMKRLTGDTIVVEDDGNNRISLFTEHGFERSYRIEDGVVAFDLRFLGLIGRTLIMTTGTYQPYFSEPWFKAVLVRHPLGTQQWDTIRFFDFARRIVENQTPNPFRPSGHAAVTAGEILVNRGDRPEVLRLDLEGRTHRIIRWREDRRVLSDSIWKVFSDYRRGIETRRSEEQMRGLLADLRNAVMEPLPYSGELRGDDKGRVWVAEFSSDHRYPARYRVFDRDGLFLGWVPMPPRFQALDIRGDEVLGVLRDEFDVEAAAVFPLMSRSKGPT